MSKDKEIKIQYSKKAVKFINSCEKSLKDRLRLAILGLIETPAKGDIKAMQGYHDGTKRLRVGKYRVIYKYTDDFQVKILLIMDIDSRGGIYK